MICLIGVIVLLVICIILLKFINEYNNEVLGICNKLLMSVLSLTLVFMLAAFPINYWSTKEEIAEFKSTSLTLEAARSQGNIMENAALQIEIIKCNQWLASAQYFKTTMWSLWVPSEVLTLKPIK